MLKHADMKPANKATMMPFVKLKSFTASRFSSSESDAAFIEPAIPIIAIPTSVTTTPIITDVVRSLACPVNSGAKIVPSPAQVPSAIDWPRATPRYLIDNPKVRPPIPHNTP